MECLGKSHPCYACDKRHVGCHAECEAYMELAQKRREREQHILNNIAIAQFEEDMINKMKRRMKYKK